jgi:hypothetical protein
MTAILCIAPPSAVAEGGWWDGFVGRGLSGTAWGFVEFEGDILTCGRFFDAQGEIFNVARWSGSSWEPVGGEVFYGGRVYTMAVYRDTLYAGGLFNYYDDVWSFRGSIAKWNGETWESVSTGLYNGDTHGGGDLPSKAWELTVFDSLLVVGGTFIEAGGTDAAGLAAWDGERFIDLGANLRPIWTDDDDDRVIVKGTTVFEHDLVVGGWCDPSVARWVDRTAWTPLRCLDPGRVEAVIAWNDDLIVAFWLALNCDSQQWEISEYTDLAVWGGTEWLPFADPALPHDSDEVLDFAVYRNDLIAGGRFPAIGGTDASNIARWDGTAWSPLGGGLDDDVLGFHVFEGDLWVAGDFEYADSIESRSVARWREDVVGVSSFLEARDLRGIRRPLPNPTTSDVSFSIELPGSETVTISILDVVGRLVATIETGRLPAGLHEFTWDGTRAGGVPASPGTYFMRAAIGTKVTVDKLTLLR